MPIPTDIAELAYEVRTSQRAFKDVPEAQRKDVAVAMRAMRTPDYQAVADRRRTPRGAGYGEHTISRVN
jgi:hypothetical protein